MQRPNASRRRGAGAIDRRVAAGAFLVAAIVVLVAVALTRAPLPEVDIRDPAAARDLVALMRAGERGGWVVTYDYSRTLVNGQVRHDQVREGRSPPTHVVISGTAMTIEQGDRSYECTLAGTRSGCETSTTGRTLPASEVLRVAVQAGAYDVVRQAGVTIAGTPARCFRVRATGRGGLPGLGVETKECLSATGIPLQLEVVRAPGTVDAQVATQVRTHATIADVDALAASFARETPSAQR